MRKLFTLLALFITVSAFSQNKNVSVIVKLDGANQTSPLSVAVANFLQRHLENELAANTAAFKGKVQFKFGYYPDSWVGRVRVSDSDNPNVEMSVTNALYLFNQELANRKKEFGDEVYRNFVAAIEIK